MTLYVPKEELPRLKAEFEAWLKDNTPFYGGKNDSPECWGGSESAIEEHNMAPYREPWVRGAWEVWKALKATKKPD